MRSLFLLTLLLFSNTLQAQDIVEWDGKYQIVLADFRSAASQIGETNIYSLQSGSNMNFAISMSNAEFMFTKNFNSKVNCFFNRNAASLVAPDTSIALDLLSFARYDFDLAELYARKLRKKLFEEKGTFSNIGFFMPVYEQIQKEYIVRHTIAAKSTDVGRNREELTTLHGAVLSEIEELADFCKSCKLPKKKK